MTHRTRTGLAAALAAALLIAPLAGCAPEPDPASPEGRNPAEKQEPEGGSWPEKAPDEAFEKQQEVPESFPEGFVIPDGAVIDDVGDRGAGSWFIVFRAADEAAGDALWDLIISSSEFAVTEAPAPVEGGRSAELNGSGLAVTATMFPDTDGTMLLSYDLGFSAG